MPSKSKLRPTSSVAQRVRQALRKNRALVSGSIPSVEREIGRLPRKKHSEAKRLAAKIELEARVVWNRLQKAGGAMPFDDHSSADEIQAEFGISKKAFKRGLGRLYRQRRVELLPRGVRAVTPPANDEDRKR